MGRKSVGDSEEEEQSSCDVRVGGSLRSTLTRARARKVPSKTVGDVFTLDNPSLPFFEAVQPPSFINNGFHPG